METPPGLPGDGFDASTCKVGHSVLTEDAKATEAADSEGRVVLRRDRSLRGQAVWRTRDSQRARVKNYRATERDGIVWMWMGACGTIRYRHFASRPAPAPTPSFLRSFNDDLDQARAC